MVSKTVFGIAAGIAGTLAIGYCVYFDRKRRSDPLFWQKLKERRNKVKEVQSQKPSAGSSSTTLQLPNLKDPESVQQFFLAQVQRGEELLAEGNLEAGTECLCNAVAVCGQPDHLLQVLQQTLPQQVFNLLMRKLPETSERMSASLAASGAGPLAKSLVEDDLE